MQNLRLTSNLVTNPEDRFSRDEAHINFTAIEILY